MSRISGMISTQHQNLALGILFAIKHTDTIEKLADIYATPHFLNDLQFHPPTWTLDLKASGIQVQCFGYSFNERYRIFEGE